MVETTSSGTAVLMLPCLYAASPALTWEPEACDALSSRALSSSASQNAQPRDNAVHFQRETCNRQGFGRVGNGL